MKAALALVSVALLLGGCGQKGLPKDDAQAAQYAKDEQACRTQVRQTAQSERTIEDQRRATFDGERERFGQQGLYTTMANQGYTNNFDRLLANCMENRGWAPKKASIFPKLSW
jgi:predicted small lipoprotein YifL